MYRLIRFFLIFFILILFFSENSHSGLVKLNPIKVIDKNSKDDSDNGNFFDFGSLKPSSDETSVLTVILNDQNRGEYFVKLAQDGDILFPSDNLKNLGFKEIPAKAVLSEKGYVSLKSLFPEIRFETDEKTLTVTITADPQLLETSRISLVRLKPLEVVYTENSSAFLNYSAGYTFDNKYNVNMLNIPIETGIRIGDYLALSEFSYTRSGTDSEFIRLMTSITGDDPLRLRRYIFGDFIADSGTMGSSSILGGLSISKNFSLSPYFIRFPEAELSGIIQSPSDVEVYVNGSLIQKTHLSPGEFELFNLPVTSGAGDVTLIIRDAYGREKRVVYPFYASSALLKPGLHEYSYNVGFKREGLGEKNFEYRDPAFTGFHRLGISETFTAGLRFEADCDTLSFGTSAVFLPGKSGEIETAFGMSYDNGVYGYGVVSDYSYSSGIFSSRISLRHYSKDYANLSLSALNKGKARFQGLVSAGFYHEKFGSLSGIFSVTDRYEYTDTEEFLLSYSRLLGKNLWLQITGSLTKDDDDINYELFSGLSFGFEYDISGNIHRQQNRRGTDIHAGICKNPPQNTGSGYRANAEIRENESGDSEISGDAGFQYNTDHGIYTAQYHGYRNQSIYDLKFAGSLLFIDDSFFFSRPVYDSFALVKVGDIKDVKVKSGGSDAGKTDSDGEMIAPDIVSYYHNNLSIEPSEIPIEYEIKETSKHIAVPYRSGGIVSFDVKKLRAAEGRLYFLENGEKIPAEYAVLKIRVADKTVESVTGTEGAFYLENLPAGEFSAGVFSGDKECQFDMVIPESDEITLNMGEVICELAN